MKRIFLLALIFLSFKGFGQYPAIQTIGNDSNVVIPKGALKSRIINNVFTDTTAANLERIKDYPGAQIFTSSDESFWLRNSTATAWLLSVVGVSGLDTVYVSDDLYIDSLLHPGFQTIRRYHSDGFVSIGRVIWSGVGLRFYITPSVYYLNQKRYVTPMDTVTLDAADPTNGRFDVFIVDTIPDNGKITGTPSSNPAIPTEDQPYQLVLARILINAGDTIPTSVTSNMIYNENVVPPEWVQTTTGTLTTDYNNLANPALGSKALYVSSYTTGARLFFTYASTETVDPDMTYSFFIYSNGQFNNSINFRWLNGTTAVSNVVVLNASHGFNPLDSNRYQLVTIPLTAWNWPGGTTFNRIRITMTGTDNSGSKGFYLDAIQLQNGIINVPPPNDFSNKLDSMTITKTTVGVDTSNLVRTWIKGIPKIVGTIWTGGTSGGGGGISEVLAGYGLVQVNDSTLRVDSTLLLTKLMAAATYQPHITLTTTGSSGVSTFDGTTLNIPNYAGTTITKYYQEVIATAGQTTVSFTTVPETSTGYMIYLNGGAVPKTYYTVSTNDIIFDDPLRDGDSVILQGIQ